MSSSTPSTSASPVLKAAGVMGVATLMSRVMGLVREQVIAYFFGAGNMTDAYNVAFRIPNLLRDLFAEGAMSASLVPTFTQTRLEEGERRSWRVAGLVFRVLFVTVGILSLVGICFAPELVDVYASSFRKIPGKFELTVQLTRIMFPFFPSVALAAAFMGILNACGVFFLPAFASALFNISSVIVGVVTAEIFLHNPQLGIQPIVGMALGVLAGGMVQALCQLPSLYRVGYRRLGRLPMDPVWYRDPRLKQILGMMLPGTIGLAATQLNLLVNTVLATSQGPGAVSWLNYAFRLMQFPIGIFGVSLASATLPRVSQQWTRKDPQGVANTLTQSIRSVFAINLPASAGLAFLGYPIMELIFQYGRFYPEDVRASAKALAMYSIGLTAYSLVKVLVPACYAMGNTRLPVFFSFITVAVTVVLNLAMIQSFGYWGLALGTSLAAILNGLLLIGAVRFLIQKKGGKLHLWPLFQGFLAYLLIALSMGTVCYMTSEFLNSFGMDLSFHQALGRSGVVLSRALRMLILIAEGLVWVVLVAKIFRLKEATAAIDIFREKLKNKLRRNPT